MKAYLTFIIHLIGTGIVNQFFFIEPLSMEGVLIFSFASTWCLSKHPEW